MTKQDLVTRMSEAAGITKTAAGSALTALLNLVTDTVANGEDVRVPGFGTFVRSQRRATKGRNPQTGAAMDIAASTSMKLRPSRKLRDKLSA